MIALRSDFVVSMPTECRALTAKRACTRCSIHKRKCDRALPDCGLCTRLNHVCIYQSPQKSLPASTPPPSSGSKAFLGSDTFTPSQLKNAIINRLGSVTPEDITSAYCREIEPWFPVVLLSGLRNRLPTTWDEASLDAALFCLSVILLTTTPASSSDNDDKPEGFRHLYLCTKSYIALAEGLGINSVEIAQARILVNLFEVVHGFYPAASISIGSTIRAVDALERNTEAIASLPPSLDDETKREEIVLIWCGILVLDRYIAIESGLAPSITRSRHQFFHHVMCSAHQHLQDRSCPVCRFNRLVEASFFLDKCHAHLSNSLSEDVYNMEELVLLVRTLVNLKGVLTEEVGDGIDIYSGGLCLCNLALLLAFEKGSKVPPLDGVLESCSNTATKSLDELLHNTAETVEPFVLAAEVIDFNLLLPFVTCLVYRAAVILTKELLIDLNSPTGLKSLRTLRAFLEMMGKRWLGSGRYLKLLDEDTTPRILRATEQV